MMIEPLTRRVSYAYVLTIKAIGMVKIDIWTTQISRLAYFFILGFEKSLDLFYT